MGALAIIVADRLPLAGPAARSVVFIATSTMRPKSADRSRGPSGTLSSGTGRGRPGTSATARLAAVVRAGGAFREGVVPGIRSGLDGRSRRWLVPDAIVAAIPNPAARAGRADHPPAGPARSIPRRVRAHAAPRQMMNPPALSGVGVTAGPRGATGSPRPLVDEARAAPTEHLRRPPPGEALEVSFLASGGEVFMERTCVSAGVDGAAPGQPRDTDGDDWASPDGVSGPSCPSHIDPALACRWPRRILR